MSSRVRMSVIIVAIAYVVLHVATLNISPLPWFDEIVFADITQNYADHGSMELTVVPLYYSGVVYQYGPVYFVLQALVVKMFGMSVVSFRLINLLCGFGVVAIACNIFRRQNDQIIITCLLATLILSDTIFNQNLHSGRMDLVAVFFVMCSLLCGYRFRNEQQFYQVALVGVFAALAFLTTPRSLFLLTAPAALLLIPPNKSFVKNCVVAGVTFIVPILITIQLTVGLLDYFHGMTSTSDGKGGMPSFIGGSLLREPYENPAIVIMIIVAAVFYKKVIKSPLLLSLLIGFCSFSLFVKEAGPYSAMMMPFIYFVIVAIIANENSKVRYGVILFLLVINLGIFAIKTLTVVASARQRNVNSEYYSHLESIPRGSRVLSDYRMYYWAIDHNDTFESYGHYRTSDEQYVNHVVDEFVPDYVILAPGDRERKIFTHPSFTKNYEIIDSVFIDNGSKGKLEKLIRRFVPFDANFECLIYKKTPQPR